MTAGRVRVAVVLEVAWSGYDSETAPRWFRINPRNHSGARLIAIIGHDDFVVTNACRGFVASARQRGLPDHGWLQHNLQLMVQKRGLDLLLVGGRVAQRAFECVSGAVPASVLVEHVDHPAARRWTTSAVADARAHLAAVQMMLSRRQRSCNFQ